MPTSLPAQQKPNRHLRLVSNYDPVANGALCHECPLNGFTVVPPTFVPKPMGILVGMEPGFEEEREGVPFFGPSGQRLNASLARVGIERKRMHVTNSILCRPRREQDRAQAIKCCSPRLHNELGAYPKTPVITMGKEAFQATLKKKIRILLVRGFVWKMGERYVFPTVHPAFLLRNDGKTSGDAWLPIFTKDLERAAKYIVYKKLRLEKAPFTVPKNALELRLTLAKMAQYTAIDIETTRDSPRRAKMLCVGISDGKTTVVVPWQQQFVKTLDDFCRTHTIICHNGPAFDHIVLRRYGVHVRKWEDTLVGHHVFNGHLPQRLDHVVSVYLDAPPWKLEAGRRGAGNEEKGELIDVDDPAILYPYNAMDAALTARVWWAILPELKKHWAVYLHDKDKSQFCDEMQDIGIKVDLEMQKRLHKEMSDKRKRLKYELRKLVGWKFNPNAPKDIAKVLFGQLKAPIYKRTKKTGAPSTDADVLEAFAKVRNQAYGPFCKKILDYRKVAGRMKYLDMGPAGRRKSNGKEYAIIIEADGRIHPGWKACRPVTGRLSCASPNLQNLEKGSGIRALYVAEEGWILVSFDMSQVEMRTAAYISGDELFIAACESGDLHTANGKVLFPKEQALWTDPKGKKCPQHKDGGNAFAKCDCGKPFRDVSKNSGFAAVFFGTPETIYENLRAEGFDVAFKDVVQMLDAIKRSYKAYFANVEKRQAQVRETGRLKIDYVTGRERFFGRFPEVTHLANCLDAETEALTSQGWVWGLDLKPGDKLLTKNKTTGSLTWESITRMNVYPQYEGWLYEFKSRTFNAVTTPDHRWLVSKRQGRSGGRTSVECCTTESLASGTGSYSIHRTGEYAPLASPCYSDPFVELVGWVLTDGSIYPKRKSRGPQINVYQSKRGNPKKVARIDALFRHLRAQPSRRIDGDKVTWMLFGGHNLTEMLVRLFPDRTLTHEFLRALTTSQLRLLLDTMMLGDGTNMSRIQNYQARFTCRDKVRADVFQTLCTLCGIATTVRWCRPTQVKKQYRTICNRPRSRGVWIVTLLQRDTAQVIIQKRSYGGLRRGKRIDQVRRFHAKQPVWCPTVANSFFVARRHGDVFITGNSPAQSTAAGAMNSRLFQMTQEITRRGWQDKMRLVAQVHDQGIFEARLDLVGNGETFTDDRGMTRPTIWADKCETIIKDTMAPVFEINGYKAPLPIEVKRGARWSDL